MALIRQINTNENTINYISTIAFFCAISCSIIMLRFRGFKATLNLLSGKSNNDKYDVSPGEPICGAYRISRDEFLYERGLPRAPKKMAPSPSMVQLPNIQKDTKPFKSTNDLTKVSTTASNIRTNSSSRDAKRNEIDKNQIKEQKRLEKQQQEEKKKLEKLAAEEKKKEEILKKDRDKQRQTPAKKEKTKRLAPQPQVKTPNPSQQPYSTNTLESSISRSSGPPPYSPPVDIIPNTGDNSGNTSFAKATENSSWDVISQHRQEMNKQIAMKGGSKETHIDLHYNPGNLSTSQEKPNSEV